MLEVKNLSFAYEQSQEEKMALRNINLTIEQGEFVGIIGPSGAGKSTFTMALNGIIPHFYTGGAFYGAVYVEGEDTIEVSCSTLSKTIGSVLQDPDTQMITGKVEDEIAFALENQGLEREEIEKRITESLELWGISRLRQRGTAELSGGQMQRVAIAAALAQRPKVLVLDEPTSELDPVGSKLIFETLKSLNEKCQMTIVIVEQKVMLLSEYCSRLLVMKEGRFLLDGPTKKILGDYEELEELGINCPRIVRLVARLKEAGLYAGAMPTNVEETCSILKKIGVEGRGEDD